MMTAAVVLSSLSLAVSTVTLVVILTGAKRVQTMVNATQVEVESRISKFKQAMVDI